MQSPSAPPEPHDPSQNLLDRIMELSRIGIALSHEKSIDRLLETILLQAKKIAHADGGTLYRITHDDPPKLEFANVRTDSLQVEMGGTTGNPIPFPALPLYDEAGKENIRMVAAYTALRKRTVSVEDAYQEEGFDFSGTQQMDRKLGYRSQSFLAVPMLDHEGEVIGVLQLINAQDQQTGKIIPFSETDIHMVESLASQAAMALTNRLLVIQLEKLFESFVGMLNQAIDEKSPYTAGHCARVPLLTMALAEAAHITENGPLSEWSMTDRDRYELKIAGLLHDCGKVTTPVHVVDKATKLETIFDTIALIDTRFEVIKRDLEIQCLRENREADIPALYADLEADREFLRVANKGGEAMAKEDQERVRAIAKKWTWVGPDGEPLDFLTETEVRNLTIPYGTLLPEEREIINQHINVTISMLESLPWPKHLKNVPEYAGGHHERMDGKGYPRGLTRDQMSVQARVMGIADIFEALTARDRPYKPGKTLSESLKILGHLKLNGHIDPDLFDIFVRQRVYLDYAHEHMNADQIDEVDLSAIPGYQE